MNINSIKLKIKELDGCKVKLKVYLGRNKYEHYVGKIIKLYPNIFSVDVGNRIKSFTYSDVLIKNVLITKI